MHCSLRVATIITLFAVMLSLSSLLSLSAGAAEEFQKPPITLEASEVLPKNLLTGPNYRIKETVENDGFVNIYELETSYGPLRVEGTVHLLVRLNELKALQRMEKLKETDVYTEALKKGGKIPHRSEQARVTDPVDTIKDAATGIGGWFSDVGRSIVSTDPHKAHAPETAAWQAPTKRQFAYDFGINPYSGYQPLQKVLNEISRTAAAGGLTPREAFSAIPGIEGVLIPTAGTSDAMKVMVRDHSPAQLEKMNEKKLLAMGVPAALAKKFLRNPHYNAQEITLLVGELYSMKNVKDRQKFILSAVRATEESLALFMRAQGQMIAAYSAYMKAQATFVNISGTPFLKTKDGVLVGLFPLDHIAYTPILVHKENALSEAISNLPGIKGKELWIGWKVAPAARKALEANGWRIQERVYDMLGLRALDWVDDQSCCP